MTTEQPSYYPAPQRQRPPKNGLGTASLVVGIVGMVLAFIPVIGFAGFILGVLGIIFGGIGVSRVRRGAATNRGSALAGLILSVIAVIVSTVVWFTTVDAVDDALNETSRSGDSGGSAVAIGEPAEDGDFMFTVKKVKKRPGADRR